VAGALLASALLGEDVGAEVGPDAVPHPLHVDVGHRVIPSAAP
jgi:hypothetical protein